MLNQEKKLGIYIKLEDDKRTINYMAIGQMINRKFNGIICNTIYGVYEDWYVYQDKLLPTSHKDNEAVKHDVASQWLNHLVKDSNFTKDCYEKMSEYALYESEHIIKDEKLVYFENNCYSKNIGITSKIVANSDTAEYYDWSELTGLFDWKSLIKDCFEHQVVIDENGELSSSELISEAVNALIEDDVYCGLFSRDKVEKYITQIVEEIESRNGPGEESNLCNINIQECDICVDCGKVALPDDELYEKHNRDSLCAGCSFLCEGCNQYFSHNEVYIDIDGVKGCKKCIEKESSKAFKEFEVIAIRNEEYRAKIIASSQEEAEKLADENYSDYVWSECDGTLDTQIVKSQKNNFQNFEIGDIVTIDENDIDSSADLGLLKRYLDKKLLIVAVSYVCEQLVHYTCKYNGQVIMYKENIPFGFIDADLKHYVEEITP